MKKIYTTAMLSAAVLAGAAFGPTVVNAQTSDTETDTDTAVTAEETGRGGMRGPRGDKGEAVAEVLGLTQDEVREAMRSGSTVADLAAANGVEIQTVIDAIIADMTEHINEHVTDGDLTADEAATKLANAETRATDLINGVRPEGGERRVGQRGQGGEVITEALGLTGDEIKAARADGSTIADIAAAQGVDVQVIVDAIVANMTEHINDRVTDGDLTADEAATKLADAEARATDIVNGVRPEGGEGRGIRGSHHGPADGPADAPAQEVDA